jgi:organic hydroperoxide reductase OsmC/OhrA
MEEADDGGGQFTEVVLHPLVRVAEASMLARAVALHERAHALCFIARSCNFPVRCEGRFEVEDQM